MAFPGPGQNDRDADKLEDLAQALDAGIDLDLFLGDPAGPAGENMLEKIRRHGPATTLLDRRILEAAERAGELPRALRERAAAKRFLAETKRLLIRQLSYPSLVLVMAALVTLLLTNLGMFPNGGRVLTAVAVLIALALVGLWQYLRSIPTNPERSGKLIPGLHRLLQDYGELPYLEALHGLYAAGIPIIEAHQDATRTCPVAWLRMRLTHASRHLTEGSGLAESLAMEAAVCADTQGLLSKAELSGNLEDAVLRAADRRRQVLRRKVTRASKALGTGSYIIAVLVVAMVAISFYSSYLSAVLG